MRLKLDQIESRLKQIFELRAAPKSFDEQIASLARQLVKVIAQSTEKDDRGNPKASDNYVILLSPATFSEWQSRPELLEVLSSIFHEAIIDSGLETSIRPVFQLEAEPSFSDTRLQVLAFKHSDTSPKTAFVQHGKQIRAETVQQTIIKAFLLSDDGKNLLLDQPVINIGRKRENHIVLQDRHVSREHAQIRMIQGHFVLFDLNATGGTFVNGQRITQHTLRTGDVISLAGYPLIYSEESGIVEDTPQPSGITKTTKIENPGEDEEKY